jgi:zearalenone synthase (highly reducing iterative type I polyketide synthase)
MKPQLVATSGSTPATWWEFTVSSCAGTDQLRDNCRGLITIDYEGSTSQQMAHENSQIVSGRIADYRQVLQECPATYAKDRFYKHMMKAAWRYGETFQGVENCHPGDGKTVFDVKLIDIGETFSKGQLDRPFLIHGATLDAVFQGWLGSTYKDGTFEFDKPFVPTKIGEMEISVDVPSEAGYMMPGLCRSHRSGFNELSADTIMFDKELSRVILSVIDFRTSELEMDEAATEETAVEVDPAEITSQVRWDYALSLMEPCHLKDAIESIAAQDRLTEVIIL